MAKILAFHGYMQNSSKIESALTKLLRAELKPGLLICPNGTYCVDEQLNQYGWFKLPSKDHIRMEHNYEDIENSVDFIKNLITKHGDFDIVIGFSQGAVFATILASLGILKNVKVFVMMSGSEIQDVVYRPSAVIDGKLISLVGIGDELINEEDINSLAKYYRKNITFKHKSGHVIPTDSQTKNFLKDQFRFIFK